MSLVVSLHDVSPASVEVFDPFCRALRAGGVGRMSLLVVPRWHGEPPFTGDAAFVRWLHDREGEGHEVSLHGYSHRDDGAPAGGLGESIVRRLYTAGEGEFFRLGREEAERRLREGLEIFREAGFFPLGFTPPAWLLGPGTRQACRCCGLRYITALHHVDFLPQNVHLRAPVLSFSSRRAWRRALSRLWGPLWISHHAEKPLVRVAVHPCDLQFEEMKRAILRLIALLLYRHHQVRTYADLVPGRLSASHS